VNLAPPPTSQFWLWVSKHTKAMADYCSAVFQLSKLTANITSAGVTQKTLVVFTGRNAELNIGLDFLDLATCFLDLIDVINSGVPWVSEAEAESYMTTYNGDCGVFFLSGSALGNASFAVVENTDSIEISEDSTSNLGANFRLPVTLSIASGLEIDFSCTGGTYAWASLVSEDETYDEVVDVSAGSGTLVFPALTVDGCYFLSILLDTPDDPASYSLTLRSAGIRLGTLKSSWDDGASTGYVLCT